MKASLNRRQFMQRAALAGAGLAIYGRLATAGAADSPNNRILVAVMGVNGRGMDHVKGYLANANCEIAYICDVDSRALDKGVQFVAQKQSRKPKGVKDFRAVLEDKEVDVLSIATPNQPLATG